MLAQNALYFAILIAGSTSHASELPTVSQHLLYHAARIYLIANGNHPIKIHGRTDAACAGGEDVCRTYPETVRCAGADIRPCDFEWKTKSGRLFIVVTQGEQLHDIAVMEVRPWRLGDP
jgi:hypothetical protein